MLFFKLLILLLISLSLSSGAPSKETPFQLQIIHLNDFHARFEEINDAGGACKDDKCIGGFSRMFSAVNSILKLHPDSVVLNAGDNFQGSLYYNFFKWNITQYFMNEIKWDAIVLGNHEFDDGIDGVVPFIKSLKAPVVVSNMNDTLEPSIQGTYKKSVVIERNGKKIGIIGVLIKSIDELSSPGKLTFFDEYESVMKEAERLVEEEGVFTNIVLSHSGYDLEQEIAKKSTSKSRISLIVGGHSHTFLYTGEPVPGPVNPAGPYPTIVNRTEDSKQVLVVQASAHCRYLGNISYTLDENGDYVEHEGAPIFLSHDSPQDDEINEKLAPWKEEVDRRGKEVIGSSLVDLETQDRRVGECTLGNFVTDAMVYNYAINDDLTEGWTSAALAVTNPGGLRAPIYAGNITFEDMMVAQPFENTLDVGEMEGKYIKEMFEFSMTPYTFTHFIIDVNFLQVSGFQVVSDVSKPIGSRIESIKVRCANCTVPIYEDLDLNKTYKMIVPSFLRGGGDGFAVIRDNLKNVKVGKVDIDVFTEYLKTKSPIFQEIEGRYIIKGVEKVKVVRRR